MRTEITVAAEARATRGKNEARRTRRAGMIPAVVYGAYKDPVPIAVNPKNIPQILHSKTGHNTIFNLNVQGGETTPVMVVDGQYDPIRGNLLHVDLKRIDLTKRIRVSVPVLTHGEAQGRQAAGRLARSDHARNRNRVPAGRDSGALHGGRHRADDRPEQARQRHCRDRLDEAAEPARSGDRARGRHQGGGRAHAAPRPMPPRPSPKKLPPSPKSSRRARRKRKARPRAKPKTKGEAKPKKK